MHFMLHSLENETNTSSRLNPTWNNFILCCNKNNFITFLFSRWFSRRWLYIIIFILISCYFIRTYFVRSMCVRWRGVWVDNERNVISRALARRQQKRETSMWRSNYKPKTAMQHQNVTTVASVAANVSRHLPKFKSLLMCKCNVDQGMNTITVHSGCCHTLLVLICIFNVKICTNICSRNETQLTIRATAAYDSINTQAYKMGTNKRRPPRIGHKHQWPNCVMRFSNVDKRFFQRKLHV